MSEKHEMKKSLTFAGHIGCPLSLANTIVSFLNKLASANLFLLFFPFGIAEFVVNSVYNFLSQRENAGE